MGPGVAATPDTQLTDSRQLIDQVISTGSFAVGANARASSRVDDRAAPVGGTVADAPPSLFSFEIIALALMGGAIFILIMRK